MPSDDDRILGQNLRNLRFFRCLWSFCWLIISLTGFFPLSFFYLCFYAVRHNCSIVHFAGLSDLVYIYPHKVFWPRVPFKTMTIYQYVYYAIYSINTIWFDSNLYFCPFQFDINLVDYCFLAVFWNLIDVYLCTLLLGKKNCRYVNDMWLFFFGKKAWSC